jgi:hypothetical protein
MFSRSGFLLLWGCLVCFPILAQNPTSPTTSAEPAAAESAADRLVDRLVENAATLHATLPSITAHEKAESHATRGILWQNSTTEATLRVLRDPSGGFLKQSRELTAVNGKPVVPGQRIAVVGFPLSDGLVYAQDMFFSAKLRPCYIFTLASQPTREGLLELRIAANPNISSMSNCHAGSEGLTGIVHVDPKTHQLVHAERTIPDEAAKLHQRAPFASTDYAPAKIGDKTFWLPAVTVSSFIMKKPTVKVHTVAHYSDYHQYTASVTILPAASEPETSSASPQ